MSLRTSLYASTAIALAVGWAGVALADQLPVGNNLNFSTFTGASPKNNFTAVAPTGWTGGSGLIYVDSPTQGGTFPVGIQTYGNPTGTIPGNYVEADGNPHFESGFQRQLTGLTIGTSYQLSFFQAASQEVGFGGATTNQWFVSLGTSGLFSALDTDLTHNNQDCGIHCVVAKLDPTASIAHSPLMGPIPTGDTVGWEFVSVTLTADATNDLLSFLAWGDNGNTTNLPPIAFLSGVNAPASLLVSEPASLALYGVGLLGLAGGVVRRRRKAASASN